MRSAMQSDARTTERQRQCEAAEALCAPRSPRTPPPARARGAFGREGGEGRRREASGLEGAVRVESRSESRSPSGAAGVRGRSSMRLFGEAPVAAHRL